MKAQTLVWNTKGEKSHVPILNWLVENVESGCDWSKDGNILGLFIIDLENLHTVAAHLRAAALS